jgi:copper chaperone CopZ
LLALSTAPALYRERKQPAPASPERALVALQHIPPARARGEEQRREMGEVALRVDMMCEVSPSLQSRPARDRPLPAAAHRPAAAPPPQGCAGAVRRVLGKLEGVRGVEIDVATKKVVVATDPALSAQTVFDTVAKTGKKTELWS